MHINYKTMSSTTTTSSYILPRIAAIAGLALLHRYFIHERITLPTTTRRRRILITGAASGIGYETAKLFMENGWSVGLIDMNELALKQASTTLNNAWFSVCDVRDPESCERVVKEFAGQDGIDVLFNSAGLLATGLFKDIPVRKQTAQIRVNVEGVVNMTYCVLPYLVRDGGGRIVTMASGKIAVTIIVKNQQIT
jgi:short-subunit dehydrogenase